jgi:extradiol dioxygenase family protein
MSYKQRDLDDLEKVQASLVGVQYGRISAEGIIFDKFLQTVEVD